MPALLAFLGCGDARKQSEADRLRAQFCKPVESVHNFDETPFLGSKTTILSFQSIRASVNAACSGCHMAPAATHGFTYIDKFQGEVTEYNNEKKFYPGFSEVAEKMRDYILHPDPNLRMPPLDKRQKNPEAFLEIGRWLNFWLLAGRPTGSFEAGRTPNDRPGKFRPIHPRATSDLGDCVPTAKAVGFDYKADRFFELASELPKFLTDTDLFSLDPFVLAQSGTLAYNVEYPLWADNNEKGRWIHLPMKLEHGDLVKQSVIFDPVTSSFKIPENTRFYKTFYKGVKLPNGRTRMRRIETRLIVARARTLENEKWKDNALFGTYFWDESEQVATLVTAPYRDGSPWRDQIFEVTTDLTTLKTRTYLVPGRMRCQDCHMGSATKDFVLGFIPYQINRRNWGEGGRVDPIGSDEASQVDRFLSYGALTGLKNKSELPILENAGISHFRNIHELRASGYMVGNCYHCHNPDGFAFSKENKVHLKLGPGDIFKFSTEEVSSEYSNRKIVDPHGELDASYIWNKVADSQQSQGIYSTMPLHTSGGPDCKALTLIGRWVRSYESLQASELFTPSCKTENTFVPIDMDFTWPVGDVYLPRRNDWADPVNGMPQRYRDLELTDTLRAAIRTEVGSSRVDLQACKLEYSIVSPK